MFTSQARLRGAVTAAAMAAALVALGAGAAGAAGWPPLEPGARLYSAADGKGAVTTVDLADLGTCHALAAPVRSVQVADGAASVVLYADAGCGDARAWATGSLAQSNLPLAALSYRVVPA
ncbi:hypothetical protein [Kitasatospora sp. NPDC001547]|uniref:hypothetical protein n=1 Tax=Kitasatospora sp. NPDC001547 TaxID=3364015 RepID=UPI0036C2B5EA|nr:hypothetical protein KitaXyl93_12680 [Kitasatospora sp. Xyl93]